MNAKLSLGQQRTRVSSLGRPNSPGSLGAKRVSPIKEESAISPSLNAAFSSPLPTGAATTSTESTESARTIRGSGTGTPANMPLRTPSYPFPYVPGTPGAWSAAFHQPFTALSPTVTGIGVRIQSTLADNATSEGSTPAGSTATFMPAGVSFYSSEDPQYPTPNLYELALLLNCEPGLDAWWATVTKIMHNMYRAERVTIAVPADPTDIENVPWGQKASFNVTGYEPSSEGQSQDRFSIVESWVDGPDTSVRAPHTEVSSTTNLHPARSRPNLESRHSFAGHERNQKETLPIGPSGAGPAKKSTYEEYEQYPSSPWAQSPAPSPAIQTDPEDNPFFASGNVDEDSFNPTETGLDYSHAGVVEAIGVDRASTIAHIPLVHPLLSQPMQSLRSDSPETSLKGQRARGQHRSEPTRPSEQPDVERKAPIAIISILSPTVPYPQNLTQSLKLLGPHLATSFSNAQQYTSAHDQATGIRHRRNASAYNVGSESISTEPTYLDDLMPIDVDEIAGSASGSITSPSDYSDRSRHSPGGSLSGTPGWDPSNVGFSSKSVTGTPSQPTGAELVESYFDARKRSHQPKSVFNHPTAQPMQHQAKSPLRNRQNRDHSPTRTPDPAFSRKEATRRVQQQPTEDVDRRHTVLHSYGADFSASFQSLPAAATIASHSPSTGQIHSRAGSLSDSIDMPPPSERLLRTIVDSLPVQIFTAAPETGGLTWVNSKFLVYRGQDPRQVLKEPWQAIHPEDRQEYMETWNRSLRTGQQLQQKVRLLRFDGNYRWFYVRAAPLKDKRQNIVHWIGTNMDFHEQHIAELNSARQQETAASEAKYRALANSSPQIVFAVNRQKGVIFCNTQWVSYSGQTEAQALGLGFTDHVHPDDLVKCKLPNFDEDNQQPTNVPTTIPPEPRRTKSTSNSSSTGSSETERALSSPIQSSPITALPQAKLSQLASTGILKVSTDADGRPSYSTEVRLRSKDGDYRWHLVRVLRAETVLDPSETEDETWYGTCTDINDHKALERDLKETMDEKSRFLSNMSHEIRTPLNGITGMVNFLIDSSLSPEQMEHVNIIRASTEGLRGLINDILDLSKAEAGMIQLSMDWLHVRSLIEEVNDLTSAMAVEKGLQLNYLVEENVPSMVKGDRFRIRQVLLNVIGNAIKFTQKGEVFVRCEVHNEVDIPLKRNEILLQFEVVDTGSGFTEEEAKFLFKRFSQIDDSSTRQHGGTGLGLVISKQLTQLHGGDMTAAGVPGKGSTFTFFIKTVLPSENDSPPLPPPATPGYASLPLTPATNFIIATPFLLQSQRGGAVVSSSNPALGSPRLGGELTQSPSPYVSSPELGRESPYIREATIKHIEMTLPKNVPHKTTARESLEESLKMIGGEDPIIFTHVVLVLQEPEDIINFMEKVLFSAPHSATSLVVISDLNQKREIMKQAPEINYEQLIKDRRLRFIFKPLKPSKFAVVFDPQKEREMSTDRNQDSAQQVAVSQKQVFEDMTKRLGNKGKRVLLVEDNRVNQMVLLKFLSKVAIDVETVLDGVQCTEEVFAKPHGFYSIILCDLHMLNKDGYQTCKDIRRWEKKNKYPYLPIIALSANVLGDVYAKCVAAGFNSYVTKPVDFRELSAVMTTFLDPADPSKPHEFMRPRRGQS
ncbi:histidine kinase HHK2p [Cryomyces antarcticus]